MNKILLGSAVTVLLLAGCGDEKKTTAEATAKVATQETTTKNVVTEATKDVASTVSKAATEVTNTVSEATNKVVENTTEAVKETTANVLATAKEVVAPIDTTAKEATTTAVTTADKVEEVKEATKEMVVNVVEETKTAASNVEATATSAVAAASTATQEVVANAEQAAAPVVNDGLDGELLFKSCASCHGQKAEKQALGKSQVIAGWPKDKTIQALNGYKDGSYGGVMKNIMKGQVATKTDAEIDALATFISNL
jgi:cytochrome c553